MRTERPTTLKRKAMIAAAVGVMAVAAAAPAFATVEHVGGGEWTYGVTYTENFSYYDHPSTGHGSSVQNSTGLVRSPCEDGGYLAMAWQPKASNNKAYWRHC